MCAICYYNLVAALCRAQTLPYRHAFAIPCLPCNQTTLVWHSLAPTPPFRHCVVRLQLCDFSRIDGTTIRPSVSCYCLYLPFR